MKSALNTKEFWSWFEWAVIDSIRNVAKKFLDLIICIQAKTISNSIAMILRAYEKRNVYHK